MNLTEEDTVAGDAPPTAGTLAVKGIFLHE